MQLQKIEIKNKLVAQIYLHFDMDFSVFSSQKEIVSFISQNIKNSSIGYAGFKLKKDLRKYLAGAIFDSKGKDIPKISKSTLLTTKIIKIIKNIINLCNTAVKNSDINIFVFPTSDAFVKEKMSGVFGYTPYKRTFFIFINPQSRKWEKALASTIAHEFNHSLFLRYHKWETLLDSLIFEGLAENFKEQIIGEKSPWVKALSPRQSKKIFLDLKNQLNSKDYKLYQSVFLENKKYPLWAGYSLGYHIVHSFIEKNLDLKWPQILKLSPKDILKNSDFIKNPPNKTGRA